MMNMMSSTSMTSINGVMLMSIIGSSSPPPMLIPMRTLLWPEVALSAPEPGLAR